MAGSPGHDHRSVGCRRRGRPALARAGSAAREGSEGPVQRRAAARRERRGRPHRARTVEARRLHVGSRHGRDHDDALAGARDDPAEGLHRRRDHQRRRGRAHGADRVTLQDGAGADRGHPEAARGRAQGVGDRAGRHLASRPRRLAAGREGRSEEGAVGAEPGRRAGDAGSRRRRRRLRHRVAPGRPRADRRRQGARARADGQQAPVALSERAHDEGGDRRRLVGAHLARFPRAGRGFRTTSATRCSSRCARRTRARSSRTS